jgi:hypothetical protein
MTTSEFALPGGSSRLLYPEWQQPYHAALLEVDPKKLAERIAETETAMFSRLQQLSQSQESQDGHAEREAIHDAITVLRVIKRETLAFPD